MGWTDKLADMLRLNDGEQAYVGYPQMQVGLTKPRQAGYATGFLEGATGADSMQPKNPITDPNYDQYAQGKNIGEAVGIGAMAVPAYAMALRASAPKAAQMVENYMTKTGGMSHIVPPSVANEMGMATALPKDNIFSQAVANTPMARISDEGLHLNIMRKQKPEQAMTESVRSGVFYLPEGSPSMKHYGGLGGYGGTEKITGETLYKNPLFVKGSTGGKAPEAAYAQLTDKNQLKALQDDIFKILQTNQGAVKTIIDGKTIESPVAQRIVRLGGKPETFIENMQTKLNSQKEALNKASKEELLDGVSEYDIAKMDLDSTLKMIDEAKSYVGKKINTRPANLVNVEEFLSKHAPDLSDYASYIIDKSKKGNQLRYALQEAAVAQKVRDAGHDAVIGHSKGKKGPFISEVFDVRESHYPNQYGDFELNPKFQEMYQNAHRKELIQQQIDKIE